MKEMTYECIKCGRQFADIHEAVEKVSMSPQAIQNIAVRTKTICNHKIRLMDEKETGTETNENSKGEQ